jgi:hypothetical protein
VSEQRDNSGTLGKNQRREKDSHPTHTGRCVIDGKEFWISAWVKDGREGSKFFSLAFKPKESNDRQTPASAPAVTGFDDDIPF